MVLCYQQSLIDCPSRHSKESSAKSNVDYRGRLNREILFATGLEAILVIFLLVALVQRFLRTN